MSPELYQQIHLLRREVLSSRARGRVIIEFDDGVQIEEPAQARQLADAMVTMVNLPMLGRHWNVADRARAAEIMSAVLHLDLETRRTRVATSRSMELTQQILSLFPDDALFLTNIRATADLTQSPHRWASGHDTTELDAGVAIVSAALNGLLWVEDRP